MTKLVELQPNRDLLDSNFSGYKLSLDKIPVIRKSLCTPVNRVFPNSEQYSLLHAKLFRLHNHLFTDHFNGNLLYYIDTFGHIIKVDDKTGETFVTVFEIPNFEVNQSGNYQASICFASERLVIVGNGSGELYIIDSKNQKNWKILFSGQLPDIKNSFTIIDALQKDNSEEINCVLNYIINEDNKFINVLNWIVLTKNSESNNWAFNSSKLVLKGKGSVNYCTIDKSCDFLNIISDSSFKSNSISKINKSIGKVYTWQQTTDDIIIRIDIEKLQNSENIEINSKPQFLCVTNSADILLNGKLCHRIDSELTTWSIKNSTIEIVLIKTELGLMWNELIVGDESGEHIYDSQLVEVVHQRLQHLCSENEETKESVLSFTSEFMEDCDFEASGDTAVFERFSHCEVTHRIYLSSLCYLLSVRSSSESLLAFALRHDVDACIWQLESLEEFKLVHVGSLLAFGYIQASKQERKFLATAPNFKYSVICESSRHIFIYRHSKDVTGGELRNRISGKKINTIAEQQVITLDNQEVVGISAQNQALYILTEKYFYILKVVEINNM